MSRSYTSSPPSAPMACRGTALLYWQTDFFVKRERIWARERVITRNLHFPTWTFQMLANRREPTVWHLCPFDTRGPGPPPWTSPRSLCTGSGRRSQRFLRTARYVTDEIHSCCSLMRHYQSHIRVSYAFNAKKLWKGYFGNNQSKMQHNLIGSYFGVEGLCLSDCWVIPCFVGYKEA
jgi:hypothetical protein